MTEKSEEVSGDRPGGQTPGGKVEDPCAAATYTRREALAAMAKYSAAVGGTAATIVTADGLVSAASAYPEWLADFCRRRSDHWLCTWDGWETWESNGNGTGNGNGRIQF